MADFSRAILAGNLTRDPETRFTPSGNAVTTFSLAVKRWSKVNNEFKQEVSYFDIVTFGKTGEKCAERLSKGSGVLLEGRIQQRRWESEGVKRSKVEIVADNVQFLDSPRGASAEGTPGAGPAPETPDDDIPF
jgi:single-strand DNA-binding protein